MREKLTEVVDALCFIGWNVGLIVWRMTKADTPVKPKPQAPVAPAAVQLRDVA